MKRGHLRKLLSFAAGVLLIGKSTTGFGLCEEPIKLGTTEIGLYGFIKLEGLWVDRLTGSLPEVFPQNVPLDIDRASHHSQTIIDARSSRLGVTVKDELWGVKTKAVIEGDFFDIFGDALVFNSRAFRLRHAYAKAELDNGFFLLAGQYWTLPMAQPDIPSPVYVNTQNAPVGVAYARQPQLRIGYKGKALDGDVAIEIDVEKHAFNNLRFLTPSASDPIQGGEQPWPLFAAKACYLSDAFKCSLAGAISQANYVSNIAGAVRKRQIWAVCGIASFKWKNLLLWGTLNHSVGLSSMFEGWFNNMALGLTTDRFFPFKSSGGCAAVRYDWIKDSLYSDLIFGMQQGKEIPDTAFTGLGLKSLIDFRVNLFYKFWEKWLVGVEYQTILVRSFDGHKGKANDVHVAIWYDFGTP